MVLPRCSCCPKDGRLLRRDGNTMNASKCATCGEDCQTLSDAGECCLCSARLVPCDLCMHDVETMIQQAVALFETCPYCSKREAECTCETEDVCRESATGLVRRQS